MSTMLNKFKYNILFDGIEENIIENIIKNVKELSFRGGDIIFEDGSIGDELYCVLSGNVHICKVTKTNEVAFLALIKEGEFFGELEMIDDRPRSARAIAVGDCVVAAIPKKDFIQLLNTNPKFVQNLLRILSLRIRNTNQTFVYNVEQNLEVICRKFEKVQKLIEASKNVNSSLDIDKLLEIILNTAAQIVNADRGTLFLVDESKNELWSKVIQGGAKIEIRLPIGKGIAGYVAATGETINIPDAYADPRFNPEVDRATGYVTKTILCMPMKNKDGKIIGVFQLLNKHNGEFEKEDEEYIEALSVHASIAIENAQLAQRMVANERLSTVGKMAGTIIHDIKNPMGTVRVYAQVIQKKSSDEEIKKHAGEIIRQIDRFVSMTQEILDFSRGVSAMNIQEVDFGEVLDTTLAFIEKDLIRRNVELIKNLQFAGKAKVDSDKLVRVFYNIAGNAADAMPDGGKLTVNSFQKNGNIVIEFIDTGTGMPPEVKAKIFEPFFTSGKKHGTGLGMAIVKKIVDDHKGSIEVESELGKGTTIRILLPIN